MSSKTPPSPDNVELSGVFQAVKRSAKRTILTSLLLAGLTFGVLSLMAPQFQSESELAIVAKSAVSTFNDPRNQQAPDTVTTKMDREAINTHVRSMQSADLMLSVADELKLAEKPEFNSELGPVDTLDGLLRMIGIGGPRAGESERDRVGAALRDRLEVYAAKESRFIGVRATSIDPELAAEIANRVSEAYRSSLATQGVSEIDDQQSVLKGKIDRLVAELLDLETEVERYRGEINIFKGGSQNTGLNEQQLSELTAELTRTKAARAEADARARSAREMMKLGSADALPDVQRSPLIQNLVQQRVRIERQISELSATLLPGHPRMRQLTADLAGLKRQLNGEVAKVVDSLEKEAKVARGREASITASLDELKSKVVSKAPEEAKLRQLEANTKAKRNELESLQAQIEANRKKLDTRAQPVEAQLISKAQASSVPVFPKKGAMSGLVFVASMMLGLAWTIAKALFVGARTPPMASHAMPANRRDASLDQDAGPVPALARIGNDTPTPPGPGSEVLAEGFSAPRSANVVNETTLDGLSQRISDKRSNDGGHRTIITGDVAGIDASVEAIDLAKHLSANGRPVVLVDWSPFGGGLAERLAISAQPGLTELLLGTASFEDAVNGIPNCSAHVIPAGTPLSDDTVDIEPDQLNLVLDALDEAYEHIIVVGRHDEARALFEAIQGRFDAAVMVSEPKKRVSVLADPENTFLGFEVTDMDVIRFERAATSDGTPQRVVRTNKPGSQPYALN